MLPSQPSSSSSYTNGTSATGASSDGFEQVPLNHSSRPAPYPAYSAQSADALSNQFGTMNVGGGNAPYPPAPQSYGQPGSLPTGPRAPSMPSFPAKPRGPAPVGMDPRMRAPQAPVLNAPRAPQFAGPAPSFSPSSVAMPSFPGQGAPGFHERNPSDVPQTAPNFPQPARFANGPTQPQGSASNSHPQPRPSYSAGGGFPQGTAAPNSQPTYAQQQPPFPNTQPDHSARPPAPSSYPQNFRPSSQSAKAPVQFPGTYATQDGGNSAPGFPQQNQQQQHSSQQQQNQHQQSFQQQQNQHQQSYQQQNQQPPSFQPNPQQNYNQGTPQAPGQFPQQGYGAPPSYPGQSGAQSQPPPFMGSGTGMPPMPGQMHNSGPSVNGYGGQQMPNGQAYMGHAPPGPPMAGMPSMPGMGMGPPGHPSPGMPPMHGMGMGAPPMPGMNMGPPQPGMTGGPAPFMDPSGRKPGGTGGLTNESLPSVIDVLEKDKLTHNTGYFESRLVAALPPLVTTRAQSRDCGNTIPELLRSSLFVAPATANLLKDSGVPFVLHMQPMAELSPDSPPIPIVNHGEKGPVRCNRCKAYMSPYMRFIDGGRKFQCPFCFISTEVPQEYFAYLDSEGRRVDMMQRPELCLGTYEFLATKDYCKLEKLPEPPAFIFMIDVSYRAISSGFVAMICNMLRNELESLLPVEANGEESKLRVGIATFSDSVHFFNLKAKLKKPSMMTVNDFTDMFVPVVDGFLVRLEESGEMLDSLLNFIPQIFAASRDTDTILYPVIQAGMRALEAAGCPGKLFVFNFSLPVFDAPGKLKNREDRSLLGTDKEKTLLKPQIPDYTKLGEDCVAVGCCVDLFLFPNAYVDVATIGEVSKLTGGQVYKYNFFQPDKDGNRFLWDLRHDLKRNIAFDAVMRVRTNAGVRPTDYFGNMFMPNTSEVHLAGLDSEKAILAELKHDDKLEDKSIVHIQVALLYTSLSAQRRVRVMNLALMASSEFGEMYRCAEIDVIMNFMMKNSLKGLFEFSPAAIREGLAERTTKMLVAYRKHCSSQTPSGQLVLPESLKLLPVYTNCLARSDIVSGTGNEVGADDRSWLILHANSLPVEHSTGFLYPRVYSLHEHIPDTPDYFKQVRATGERMQENGAYLLENGISMFLWIGRALDNQFVQDLFGVPNVAQVDVEKGDAALSTASNPAADRVRRFIDRTRAQRPLHMRLTIVRQGDKLEPWFRRFLVEDKGLNTFQQSYVEYIYYLYNSIRDELDK